MELHNAEEATGIRKILVHDITVKKNLQPRSTFSGFLRIVMEI